MAVTPTYPGVYVEEIPSGVRTITGVSTSVTAFVDFFRSGLLHRPVQLFNFGEFEREFGGLDQRSEASYAVQQFFLNGGSEAWCVRTLSGGAAADVQIQAGINGATALTVQAGRFNPVTRPNAVNPGLWGNNLRVGIDYPAPASNNRFNLTVSLMETRDGEPVVVRSEVYRGLSMDPADLRFVQTVVNDEFTGSKLVRVTAAGNNRPLQTGTVSGPLAPFPPITADPPQLTVTIGTEGTGTAELARVPIDLNDARGLLENAIRAARPELRAFAQATVTVVDDRLRILAGPTTAAQRITFAAVTGDPTVTALGLAAGTTLDGVLSADISGAFAAAVNGDVEATIGGSTVVLPVLVMNNLEDARRELQAAIRLGAGDPAVQPADVPAFANARVAAHVEGGEERLIVLAGAAGTAVQFDVVGPDATADTLGLVGAPNIRAFVSGTLNPVPPVLANSQVNATIGGIGPQLVTTAADANTPADVAQQLQDALRAAAPASPSFADARVATYADGADNRLVVLPGVVGDVVVFAPAGADATTVAELVLDTAGGVAANVQLYALGAGPAVPDTAQGPGTAGNDGAPPGAAELIGSQAAKTGLFALENVDLFNILCLPRAVLLTAPETAAVNTAAINYCERRRAFFIVDTPPGVDDVQEIKLWVEANPGLRDVRARNAALYFPRLQVPDPLNSFRPRSVGASGTMAGLYARTDGARGVWKAPAGTEATLTNTLQLDYTLSDDENGTLNPLGINCLRTFPVYGHVSWGSRTLVGADQMASEWKYVPVRRLALFLEESLYRGLKWVVFEPNDEPLWAQIRLNVTAFMHRLYRQGAFQGQTPRLAYLVRCDAETNPQEDIDLGIVNILVGFAPLKPAEFVILKIRQLTRSSTA